MPNENLKAQKIYGKYIKELPQVTEVNDTDDIIVEDSTPITNRTKLGVIFDAIKSRIASTWKFSELGNKTILTYIMELKAKAPVFGTTSLIETSANNYKDTTVKFGKTFSKAPTVLVSLSGGSQNTKSFGVQVLSTTTSSCVIRTVNGNKSSVSIIVNWCALV